jgi:tRNA threonylcarbamoyladenosine biosynthesis protein TsaB
VILALDTSAAVSVCVVDGDWVVDDNSVLAEASEFAPRGHAELLASMIRSTMADAGAEGRDIVAVVVGTGPGPFTGLRVGLMTARTLALAWDVPVYGVCSLDALGAQHGGEVTVVADARRKEVYWASYAGGVRTDGPHVSAPGDVVVRGDVALRGAVVGRGALIYPEVFPGAAGGDPDPAWLARVVATQRAQGHTAFGTEPLYLRRPDVHGGPRP